MRLVNWIARGRNIRMRFKSRVKKKSVGILIVNGGEDPPEGKWLSLCLSRISEHTKWPHYKIYVWNNNLDDESVSKIVRKTPHAVLIEPKPGEKMKHAHAGPLQKLYETARKNRVDFIITFDTDAFPIKDNWIRHLVEPLDEDTVISGVWRDELKAIRPYIHPSCLCTSVEFIEKNNIRFDGVEFDTDKGTDTMSHFSDIAAKEGKSLFRLCRSNKNQLHYYMGGVYADLIYHQGAGSRKGVFFWGENRTDSVFRRNSKIRKTLSHLVFHYRVPFINWLMGKSQIGELFQRNGICLFNLGMEGKGFDSLSGILKRCGFSVCDEKKMCREMLDSLPDELKHGMRDSNGISIMEQLSEIPETIQIVGNYQHPVVAARDLKEKRGISFDEGLNVWTAFHNRLAGLHRKFKFPLLKIDRTEPDRYLSTIAQFAIQAGLNPDLKELNDAAVAGSLHEGEIGPIPGMCKEIYEYFEENSYPLNAESFSFQILELKKDLL